MSKKGIGKFVSLAAVAGAAAAGVSYLMRYKSFNKELDEDFRDFEGEEDPEEEDPLPDSTMNRSYVSLHADKDELLVAAGDMLDAAKDIAGAAKNVMKDAAIIVADTAKEAVSAMSESASSAKSSAAETAQNPSQPAGDILHTEENSQDETYEVSDSDPIPTEETTDKQTVVSPETEETLQETSASDQPESTTIVEDI